MNLSTRASREDDREFLWRLHRDTMKGFVAATWGWDEGFQRRRFDEELRPGEQSIVLFEDREIGMMRVGPTERELFVYAIEIAPAFQNRGLGTHLLKRVIEEAERLGVPAGLQVLRVNPARRLYERLGFRVVAETTTHFRMTRVITAPR